MVTWRQDTAVTESGGFIASEWYHRIVQNWSESVSDALDRSLWSRRVVSALGALVPRCELQLLSLQELRCAGPAYLMGVTNPAQFTVGPVHPEQLPLELEGARGCVCIVPNFPMSPLTLHSLLPVPIHGRWWSFGASFPM